MSAVEAGAARAGLKTPDVAIAAAAPPAALAAAASIARREQAWRAFRFRKGASLPMVRGDIVSSSEKMTLVGRSTVQPPAFPIIAYRSMKISAAAG
jgi:hypothetical protein